MAIIDPEGLFTGDRLAACSDTAQLFWPRLFLAANTCARIELSYKPIVARVFANFQEIPKADSLWAIFREYEENCLAILYEAGGAWWCQFITSEKYLPKYKKIRDDATPAPAAEAMARHRKAYIEWKQSKSLCNQSFQKVSESFQRKGVGVGIGVGIGSPPLPPVYGGSHRRRGRVEPGTDRTPLSDDRLAEMERNSLALDEANKRKGLTQ